MHWSLPAFAGSFAGLSAGALAGARRYLRLVHYCVGKWCRQDAENAESM